MMRERGGGREGLMRGEDKGDGAKENEEAL